MSQVLLYLGSIVTGIWGISHLIPTKNVVAGFGDISEDNRNIITMEWIGEGVSLIFNGALVGVLTYIGPFGELPRAAYTVVVAGLLALAVVSLFTGFKVKFLPFRLCPFILTISGFDICRRSPIETGIMTNYSIQRTLIASAKQV